MKKFANFATPHCHVLSLDSASTPEAFAEREVELGTGALVVTDHGFLGAVPKVYELAKKNKLVPIMGIEAYFRDDNCPILLKHGVSKLDNPDYKKAVAAADAKGKVTDVVPTTAHYNKYFHTCIHCQTEEAYLRLVKETSNAFTNNAERHGSEVKPIFDWAAMERILGPGGATLTSGCLIGVVQRHLLSGRPDIATDYYERMRSLVPKGNFFVEVFPHRCTHYWEQAVYFDVASGKPLKFRQSKTVRVDCAGKESILKASELALTFKSFAGEVRLLATKHYQTWTDVEAETVITGVRNIEEFVQNDCTPEAPDGDLQKPANEFVIALAKKYGDKILISDDAHFAKPEAKAVQDSKLTSAGGSWKFANSYHRQSSEDAYSHFKATLGTSERDFESWVDNSLEFRDSFKDFKFKPKIHLPSDRYPADTVTHLKTLIDKHGRMDWSDQVKVDRLVEEVQLLHDNGTIDLLPYFFLAEEVVDVYRQRGELAGVGRGSSGGVLINYLLGITHMDPIAWKLSLARFITLDRIKSGKLPDIDMDLGNRDHLLDPETGWIKRSFGDKAAAIATRTGLRLKSSIKDIFRSKYGRVPPDIEALCKKIPHPPQGVSDEDWVFGYLSDDGKEVEGFLSQSEELQAFVERYPQEWTTIRGMLGIHRGFSRHASATVLADVPISDFIPTFNISGYVTTQYDMVGVEAMGGLKMDFLGLLTIEIIGEALQIIRARAGYSSQEPVEIDGVRCWPHEILPHNGRLYWIWGLPDDQTVFHDICEGKTETVFQLNTHAAQKWLAEFDHWKDRSKGLKSISSVMDVANFTALDRPGPLDAYVTDPESGDQHNMLQEYARRARGMKPIGAIQALNELLPETHGVLVMQEGLEHVYKELTGCSGSEATDFRGNIAKKKMDKVEAAYPKFMERASVKVGKEDAQRIWEQIVTFGQYGFNKSILGETILVTCDGQEKRLLDFLPGDRVWGVNGDGQTIATEVVQLHDHGIIPGYEVTFDDGYKLVCSIEHKFLTKHGMKPLREILAHEYDVLCGFADNVKSNTLSPSTELSNLQSDTGKSRSAKQGVYSQVPGDLCDQEAGGEAPIGMLSVPGHKASQHHGQKHKTQPISGTAPSGFDCGNENVGEARYSASESCQVECLAAGPSRGVGGLYSAGADGGNGAFEVRGMAPFQRNPDLERSPYQMQRDTETGGFCIPGFDDLGGSGRILAFLWGEVEQQIPLSSARPARRTTGERCNAKGRSIDSRRCNADQDSGCLLSQLGRQNESRLAATVYSDAPLASTRGLVSRKIIRVTPVGPKRMYDLEVAHGKHNFLLPNGVITSNSHSVAYSITAYVCAWLLKHYNLEWWTAILRKTDKKKIFDKHWKYCRHLVDAPNISRGGQEFTIDGTRIVAPLDFLQGVGPKAHAELVGGMPYKDIEDLCQKIHATKQAGAKKSEKTGKILAGRSALGAGVIYKLIVTGTLDGLFEPGLTLAEKLFLYEDATGRAAGKKVGKKVDSAWLSLDPIAQYQLKKQIFPVSFQSPMETFVENQGVSDIIAVEPGQDGSLFCKPLGDFGKELTKRNLHPGSTGFFVVDGVGVKTLNEMPWTSGRGTLMVVTMLYVADSKSFSYQDNKKTAHKIYLDVGGESREFIAWPGKNGKPRFDNPPKGSIVLAILSRRDERPATLEYVYVFRKPLDMKETTNESEDNPGTNEGDTKGPELADLAIRPADADGDARGGDSKAECC